MLLSAALAACAMADAAGAVLSVQKLGFPWQTSDPFLFCVYHDDLYPPGNPELGPAVPQHLLWRGRNRGADFGGKWNMCTPPTPLPPPSRPSIRRSTPLGMLGDPEQS